MPSGYNANLPSDILLDSGLLYVGNSPIGVSLGNLQFDPGDDTHNVDFDGKRAPVMGLDRTVNWLPKITGDLLQLGTSNVGQVEPGATSVTGGGITTYTPKKAGVLYVTGDYLTNLRLIFQRGSGAYVQVRFPKAVCEKYSIAGVDKAEAKVSCEFQARQDLTSSTDTDVPPYVIEYLASIP